MIKISAPGKLFLSGEWAILELGNPGIVAAVNKRVYVEIEENNELSIKLDDFNIEINAEFKNNQLIWKRKPSDYETNILKFVKSAIETTLNYLNKYNPFKLRTYSEISVININGKKEKIGFGSSAASVVATVSGILALNGFNIRKKEVKDIIYKLSTIAHYFVQEKVGSGFDIAASTYGGIFVYKRFDPNWLIKELKKLSLKDIIKKDWPGLFIENLEILENLNLLVGWTKKSALTSNMIKQMNLFKEKNPKEYHRIYKKIADLVNELILAWKHKNEKEILKLIRKNEELLRELTNKSGVNIETKELRKLSEIANNLGAAGKLSGAGGGDCGIAICFDKNIAEKVKSAWKTAGFYLIDTDIDFNGVKLEK